MTGGALERLLHVADAAVAQKGRAPADCPHRDGSFRRFPRRGLQAERQASPALAQHAEHGKQHVKHGLLADIGLAARLDRLDRGGECFGDLFLRHVVRQRLAERHEQGSVQRSGRSADLHDQGRADTLQRLAEILGGELVDGGENRLEAAAHVGAVIAVADGAIEIRQFVGAGDDTLRDSFKQKFASLAIDHHGCPRNPSVPTRLPA